MQIQAETESRIRNSFYFPLASTFFVECRKARSHKIIRYSYTERIGPGADEDRSGSTLFAKIKTNFIEINTIFHLEIITCDPMDNGYIHHRANQVYGIKPEGSIH